MSKYQIQTFSGQMVDFLEPNPETILIEDIAHALSLECRFGSQAKFHYSVAQHSIFVCAYAPTYLKLEALLHDAEEAYTKDLPTPLASAISRGAVSQFKTIKHRIRRAIAIKFKLQDLSLEDYKSIKEVDLRMCVTERDWLFKNPQPLFEGEDIKPYDIIIHRESMIHMEEKFLEMFQIHKRG